MQVDSLKREAGIPVDPAGGTFAAMIGDEWSGITTTLGSREAKRTSANPAFAALLTRLLHETGIDSTSTVGIVLSGSFPSLGIAALSAVQTLGARGVMISSLGSSSFGANQPGATWLDIEERLARRGGLRIRSAMVTMGAEGDSGGGLSEEGQEILVATAARHGIPLVLPRPFNEAVAAKMEVLRDAELVINIGGSQTSLGTCTHGPLLPHGRITRQTGCSDPGRGVIERSLERGVPVIHLLNINAFAAEHGIPLSGGLLSVPPGPVGSGSSASGPFGSGDGKTRSGVRDADGSLDRVYTVRTVSRLPVAALAMGVLGLAFVLRRRIPRS
jgi:poly-gamma-glutamate system protein